MTTGACSNDRCSFAHGVEDLRPVGGVYVPPALGPFQARHQVVQKISKNRICWVKQCRKPPSRLGMVSTYHSKKNGDFSGGKKTCLPVLPTWYCQWIRISLSFYRNPSFFCDVLNSHGGRLSQESLLAAREQMSASKTLCFDLNPLRDPEITTTVPFWKSGIRKTRTCAWFTFEFSKSTFFVWDSWDSYRFIRSPMAAGMFWVSIWVSMLTHDTFRVPAKVVCNSRAWIHWATRCWAQSEWDTNQDRKKIGTQTSIIHDTMILVILIRVIIEWSYEWNYCNYQWIP